MVKGSTSKNRRIAPHDEGAMRNFSVRLTKKQYEMALLLGEGNFSAGVRWALDWAIGNGLTNDHDKGRKTGRGNLSAGVRRALDWVNEARSQNADRRVSKIGDRRDSKNESDDSPSSARRRARGRGRPALSDEKIFAAQSMFTDQRLSIKEITETLGIHVSTFYRYVNVKQGKQRSPSPS